MSEEFQGLDIEIQDEFTQYLNAITSDLKSILQQAIWKAVYQFYQPNTYERTNDLLNNISVEFINGALYVFVDTRNSYYESVYGFEVTEAVPYYVEFGHEAHNYIPPANNQFHNYMPPRRYIELAIKMIKDKYGIDAEFVLNVPIR